MLWPNNASLLARALTLAFGAVLTPVWAQSIPDAGSLQRGTERSLQPPEAQPQLRAPAAPAAPSDPSAATVLVKSFVLEGAQLIPEQNLQALLADLLGQSLTLAQLEQATVRIDKAYRDAGWYARSILPPQDVTQGTVRIQILEGKFGQAHLVSLDTASSSSSSTTTTTATGRANADFVQRMVTAGLQPGQPLSAQRLERGLLLANDLPGVEASAVMHAGQEVGTSDLNIAVKDTAFVTGDIGLSNYGLSSTGKAQVSGGMALNNLSGNGDQLALRMLGSEHLGSALARYSLPLGTDGLRLSVFGSALHYKLAGSYSNLDAKGNAYTAGVGLSYPLVRQQDRNLRLEGSLQQRRYNDDMLETAIRRQRNNVLTLGISGDINDDFGGGGLSWGGVQLVQGQVSMSGSTGEIPQDAAGPQTRGSYTKLTWQGTRIQSLDSWLSSALGQGWQLQGAISGQVANKNLSNAERMSLGGPDQVRAYPVNEAMGDEGLLLKLQLQRNFGMALGGNWQAQLFYDWGQIRQHNDLWAGWNGGTGVPNSYHLAGWGVGLSWTGQGDWRGWQVTASIATPTGSNPGSSNGRNSDGSGQHSTRGWLTLTRTF